MPTEPRLPFDDEPVPHDPLLARDDSARAFAVDPTRNVVLEASAGTGKTRVLVTRYVNLLRAGVDPANILAITFTRKAAAEMRERILGRLRELAAQSAADAARWRALRPRLTDIAISTIDAFCFSLLREFPLEADLDPGFGVADETEMPRLVDEALDGALRVGRRLAATDPDVALLLTTLGERRMRTGLTSLLDRRLVTSGAIRRFLAASVAPDPASALDRVTRRLGQLLASGEGGLDRFLRDGPTAHPGWPLVEADLRWVVAGGSAAVGGYNVARAVVDRLARYFLTDKGEPRAKPAGTYRRAQCESGSAWARHARAVAAIAPYVAEAFGTFERELNVAMVRGVRRLFRIARARYQHALEVQAAVDFPDALARALRMLRRMDEFAQSRYRLEARYHHVLVDEFQDTSRAQWRLVARLVESWGEGSGVASDAPVQPSIFVVGDCKQSIYAFRDADVGTLRRARRYIRALRPGGDVRRSISRSFRAARGLLAFTNDLFGSVDTTVKHPNAFRYGESDRFPLGPAVEGDQSPLGLIAAASAGEAASVVADEVARLLAEAHVQDRQSGVMRPARPGDIAILFRSRESHRDVEAALEARHVPTYVYKGLGFFEADEVQDLIALLRYLAEPTSDLRASAFLRSRFVRLSDHALRSLAPRVALAVLDPARTSPGGGLSDEDTRVLERLRASLPRWLSLVDRLPPAEVLDRVLTEGAYAFELRGPRLVQARENLKKVRALTRRVQNRGYATTGRLAEYLSRLSTGDESNAAVDAQNAVNLMTIHAAKGLEFPIVFLVNLGRGTGGRGDPILVVPDDDSGAPLVSVAGGLAEAETAVRSRDREETKRLLYVAVTRARERLYLSAVLRDGRLPVGAGSLAEVMPESLRGLFAEAAARGGPVVWHARAGAAHVFSVPGTAVPAAPEGPHPPAGQLDAPTVPPPADFSSVSSAAARRVAAAARAMAGGIDAAEAEGHRAAERRETPVLVGTLVHRLFQDGAAAPGGNLDDRACAARALVLLRPEEEGSEDAASLAAQAARVFVELARRGDLAALLADADCLYEVPFSLRPATGCGEGAEIVRGTIDCVACLGDGRAVVVEIKTGRRRAWHEQQLELYVRAVRALFPSSRVEGRLVYPETGHADPG